MSLVSRHLEANGIPTVVLGSARDIVEQCAVARLLFTDFPLGNPCGVPYDTTMQDAIFEMSLVMLETAPYPQSTVRVPFSWPVQDWRRNFMHVGEDNREALRQAGIARRDEQARAKATT